MWIVAEEAADIILVGQRLTALLRGVEGLALAHAQRGLDLEAEELRALLDDVLQLLGGPHPGAVGLEDEVPGPEEALPLYHGVDDDPGHDHLPRLVQRHGETLGEKLTMTTEQQQRGNIWFCLPNNTFVLFLCYAVCYPSETRWIWD